MISLGEATGQGLGGCQLRTRELMGTLQIHKRLSVMLGPRRACCITSWLDFGPLNPQRSRDRLLTLSSDLHERTAARTCAPHHTHTEKARKKGDTGRGLGKQWQSRERQKRGEWLSGTLLDRTGGSGTYWGKDKARLKIQRGLLFFLQSKKHSRPCGIYRHNPTSAGGELRTPQNNPHTDKSCSLS